MEEEVLKRFLHKCLCPLPPPPPTPFLLLATDTHSEQFFPLFTAPPTTRQKERLGGQGEGIIIKEEFYSTLPPATGKQKPVFPPLALRQIYVLPFFQPLA